jgi:phenylacetic acid degradation operon negative regulatory protein
MQQSRNILETPGGTLLERPLSARSVMASLLLGRTPPAAPVADLVRWCSLFGISEGTARVALHRMVVKDELVASDGVYRLAGRLARRQARQETSLTPEVRRWSGEWRMATVVASRRAAATRADLRDAMRRLHFAEAREGVWLRPDNLTFAVPPVAERQCEWFVARPDDDPVALAARLFRPERWAARAVVLERHLAAMTERLGGESHDVVADAFVAGAAALRHVGTDPLLPAELLPLDWPGESLRARYAEYQRAFDGVARDWFRGSV